MTELQNKLTKLKKIIGDMRSVLLAYSGGVDSTFLLKIAKDTLGDGVIAVTANSMLYPEREYKAAKQTAKMLGVKHIIIHSEELNIPKFAENSANRCYFCKRELFTKLKAVAKDKGLSHITDGTNADDTKDFRPGIKALQELGIRTPLMEANFTKNDIRQLSQRMGLHTWDKPSFACLASRFPYGDKITPENLRMVQEAEDYLSHA